MCRMFPGFRLSRGSGGAKDFIDFPYFKWKSWQGSKMKPGQNTTVIYEDPRKFIHVFFTQHGNECQFMSHAREAGGRHLGTADQYDFRPSAAVLTCNTENIFQEDNFRIDDDNKKFIISYPGKEQKYTKSGRTETKSSSDGLSSLFKKHEIPLHSKNINLKEKQHKYIMIINVEHMSLLSISKIKEFVGILKAHEKLIEECCIYTVFIVSSSITKQFFNFALTFYKNKKPIFFKTNYQEVYLDIKAAINQL